MKSFTTFLKLRVLYVCIKFESISFKGEVCFTKQKRMHIKTTINSLKVVKLSKESTRSIIKYIYTYILREKISQKILILNLLKRNVYSLLISNKKTKKD